MEHASKSAGQAVQADDIASLKRHLPGGRFDYVDVASAQAHKEALRRWPLLSELDAWPKRVRKPIDAPAQAALPQAEEVPV